MTVAAAADPMEAIRARVGDILEQDRWPRERLLGLQRERLEALLRHAVERSPYYRQTLGVDAAERPLDAFPTLSKPRLLEEFDRIVTEPRLTRVELETFLAESPPGALFDGRYRVFSTSGATGMPGLLVYAPDEFMHWIAVGLARLSRVGVTAETRLVAIGAPGDVHITRQLFAAFQAARDGVPRISVVTPVAEAVEALNRYQPEALIAYASVLAALAEEQLEGRLQIAPRVTIATSEVLTEEIVECVKRAWGKAPVNAYAATEAPGIAIASLDEVGMHVCEESVVLEAVDADNRPVRPGEPGAKVLLTNLVNRTQPLIRYELSDSVVLAEGEDPSGRPYLRLARVDGRSDDILELPAAAGGVVLVHPFRLRAPFVRMHDVRQYQIVQRSDGLFVRILPRAGAARNLPEDVRAAVAAALTDAGAETAICVTVVDEIERESGPAAKVKLVIREV